MYKPMLIAAAAAALAVAPAAMAKDNGKGHGKGHAGHSYSVAPGGHWALQDGRWVTPGGVAHPHGMPPGQAKKIARARGDLVVGNVLPAGYPGYRAFNGYSTYALPAPPAGYEYVRVGNEVYLRQSTTGVIANVIADLFR